MRGQDVQKAREIGRRIAQARKEVGGMTQRELGELLGVTERSVAAYESGEVIPYRFLHRLGEVFGREPAWILHGEEAFEVKDEQFKQILEELAALRREVERLAAEKDGAP